MTDWKRAFAMLNSFERNERMNPVDAKKLVAGIFRACGHPVRDTGFIESDGGVDMFVETTLDGKPQRISVEVKHRLGPAREDSVRQLLAFRENAHIGRAMIISRAGFTPGALQRATENGVGLIDLLSPADLRNWLRAWRRTSLYRAAAPE